ncbi:MAG: shikimate dehydrogenase [Wenzhouxiangella sp.]
MNRNRLKLAVFGDPVAHSRSPDIHALFGQQLGLDVDYQRIQSGVDALPARLAAFLAEGGCGANLTVPLKEAGRALCQSLDPAAQQAGAVNTLAWDDAGWQGFNTDGGGLLLDLERLGVVVKHARVLIIGAGGATAGILGPLLGAGAAQVHLLNRSLDRAQALAERFAGHDRLTVASLDAPGQAALDNDLLIQSTSLGHAGQCPPLEADWLKPDGKLYDLNYGPAFAPVAAWSSAHSRAAVDGLGMLVGQAALAFEIWTGHRPAIEPVIDALRAV